MIPTAARLRNCMAELPLAGPGDYRSHQEFAECLFPLLAGAREEGIPEEGLSVRISGLIRRREWYEEAVLRDLRILDAEGRFRAPFLRAWALQAGTLERCPPYNVLRSIALAWEADGSGRFMLFLPGTLPEAGDGAALPVPKWVQVLETPLPEGKEALLRHLTALCVVLGEHPSDLALAYYQSFMEREEPELLTYNLPMLRDMHREESAEEREERIEGYARALEQHRHSYGEIKDRIREAFALAESMGVEQMKGKVLRNLR